MSTNYTITLSLGSGEKAEQLADAIRMWAGLTPVSEAIRNLLKKELGIKEETVLPTVKRKSK